MADGRHVTSSSRPRSPVARERVRQSKKKGIRSERVVASRRVARGGITTHGAHGTRVVSRARTKKSERKKSERTTKKAKKKAKTHAKKRATRSRRRDVDLDLDPGFPPIYMGMSSLYTPNVREKVYIACIDRSHHIYSNTWRVSCTHDVRRAGADRRSQTTRPTTDRACDRALCDRRSAIGDRGRGRGIQIISISPHMGHKYLSRLN